MAHARRTKQQNIQYVRDLARFVTTEPYVTFCIKQISNDCLTHPLKISERGHSLQPRLQKMVQNHFVDFADSSLYMMYMCGFVAYYIKKVDGVPMPHLLPLGSFTWHMRRIDNAPHMVWPYELKLDGIDVNFDSAKIHIFPFYDSPAVYSPLDGVFELYSLYKQCRSSMVDNTECQRIANVVVTETVDLKDQTISGLQLLDETRRYAMSGMHPLAQTDVEIPSEAHPEFNVTGMKDMWIQRINDGHPNVNFSTLPPNSLVTQLNMPTIDVNIIQEFFNQYLEGVLSFFNIQHRMSTGQFRVTSTQPNSNMKNQYNNILAVCRQLENLLAEVYSVCFQLDPNDVTFKLTPEKKLEVTSVADIKILAEHNIFSVAQLRTMF